MTNYLDLFNKLVSVSYNSVTGWKVECPLDLWGVAAPTREEAVSEGKHLFYLHFVDGYYDEYIGHDIDD